MYHRTYDPHEGSRPCLTPLAYARLFDSTAPRLRGQKRKQRYSTIKTALQALAVIGFGVVAFFAFFTLMFLF